MFPHTFMHHKANVDQAPKFPLFFKDLSSCTWLSAPFVAMPDQITAPNRSFAEPLVAILHVGFSFVPAGFLLTETAALWPEIVPRVTDQHTWMAGAIAVMTLAVMTRASLGHSGQPLAAGKRITTIYGLAAAAAVTRIISGIFPSVPWLLEISGATWIVAFLGFVFVYAPLFVGRPAKQPNFR